MEQIELNYSLELKNAEKIINIALYDQKNLVDKADEIIVKGLIFIDLIFENQEVQHEQKEFQINLNKCKYHKKELNLKINDYTYSQEGNICKLNVIYEVEGEDVSLEKFCFIDNPTLENELRDYLHRGNNSLNQLDIDEEKIVILDPIIEEEPHKVEIPIEETRSEEKPQEKEVEEILPVEEVQEIKKEPIFNEKYSSSHLFYRIKKNDTLESIAENYKISKEKLLSVNAHKEFKENDLIQIPKNV